MPALTALTELAVWTLYALAFFSVLITAILLVHASYNYAVDRAVDAFAKRASLAEDREVAALDAIPFMHDWPVCPENRFERETWRAS